LFAPVNSFASDAAPDHLGAACLLGGMQRRYDRYLVQLTQLVRGDVETIAALRGDVEL